MYTFFIGSTIFPPYPRLFHTPPLLDKTSRPSVLVLEAAATTRQCCAYAAYTVTSESGGRWDIDMYLSYLRL